ncbi:Uncharacterised protein [Klebsiella pneumoniae]|nr:Uncharacterised protein [Klebsiella pneumoniae]
MQREDRGNIDQRPPASWGESGQRGIAQTQQRGGVERMNRLVLAWRTGEKTRQFRGAGVVNEQVDGGILLQTLLYGGNPVLFAKIGFEDACLDGVARLQLVGERLQTVFTTGGEDQVVAAGGESFGIDRADT